jgi:hypothetical protein
MFLVNSRLGHFTAALRRSQSYDKPPQRAPLLPKLRGQVAEFLNEGYLARLGIFYPPTCGRLGYGYPPVHVMLFLDGASGRSALAVAATSPCGPNISDRSGGRSHRVTPRVFVTGQVVQEC